MLTPPLTMTMARTIVLNTVAKTMAMAHSFFGRGDDSDAIDELMTKTETML